MIPHLPSPSSIAGSRRGARATPRLLSILLLAGAALLPAACRKKAAPAAPPPPPVQVLEITTTNLAASHEIIGQLDSPRNVDVRARVEAFVDKMLFEEGTDVKEGDVLFLLDKRPFEERLAAARGQLAQANASLTKYQRDVDRLRPLAEKKAIPRQDLENAEAAVEVGKAAVTSAEAVVQSSLLDLDYCTVRAPLNGRIGAKQVSVGDLVGKGEPTLLATISTLNPIWFYCAVSEVQYLKTAGEARRRGKEVPQLVLTLILSDGTEHPDKGRIVFLDRAVDPKTGTLRVRAEFPNATERLRPGMFARLRMDLGARPNAIVIPQRALVELQGRYFVWVVGPDQKAGQRPVTVGEAVEGTVLIEDGLKAGDRIIVEGLQKVREGSTVTPMTADQMAEAVAARQAAAAPAAGAAAKPAKE